MKKKKKKKILKRLWKKYKRKQRESAAKIFSDLQAITPYYYKSMVEKYGSDEMVKDILGSATHYAEVK